MEGYMDEQVNELRGRWMAVEMEGWAGRDVHAEAEAALPTQHCQHHTL